MASCEPEEISTKEKLSKLRCPFTWDILDSLTKHTIIRLIDSKEDELDDDELCPVELLIKSLLRCYKAVLSIDDFENALVWLTKAEELLMLIQQDKVFCQTIRAIEHVFYATKCFYLYETICMEDMNELKEILENIIDTEDFSNAEKGALYGCESIVWSCLNDFGMDKAVETAEKAVKMNEDCSVWHFILAKNVRRKRRLIELSSQISDMEQKHFELAYAMSSDNPIFGVYFLQMRIEKFYEYIKDRDYAREKYNNEKEVLQIARQILKEKPTSYKVLLKLALMFLRVNNSDETLLAKECLDAVEKMAPNSSTYLHYSGMLYENCGEFREALQYYKKAAEYNNFVAELAYIRYGWETGELEPLPHLLRMLKKYEHAVKERQITMFLSIAITYYSIQKDVSNAAEYFLKALTVDPLNQKFKVFFKFLNFNTPSILNFLNLRFLPEAMKCRTHNSTLAETCRKITELSKSAVDVTKELGCLSLNS